MHHTVYILIHGRRHYWNGCGWGARKIAREYTEAEAEQVLRRAMIENVVKPKIEKPKIHHR